MKTQGGVMAEARRIVVSILSVGLLVAAGFVVYEMRSGDENSLNPSAVASEDPATEKGPSPEICIGCTEPTAFWTPRAPLTSLKSLVFEMELYGSGAGDVTGLELSDLSVTGSATRCSVALDLQPDVYFTSRSVFVSCQTAGTVQVSLAANSLVDRNGKLGPTSQSSSDPVEIVNGAVLNIRNFQYVPGSEGGSIVSTALGISCRSICTYVFPAGQTVTLTAVPDPKNIFFSWSGACSGTSPCTLTLNGDTNVESRFVIGVPLSVTRAGNGSGTVTSSPSVINCGNTCAIYNNGNVTLTAKANRGSVFAGWFGEGCTGIGTCTVSQGSVFAVFNLK